MTDLSIIIVNYNCWEHLKRCLLSLEYLREKDAPVTEFLVVDNASPEDRVEEYATLFPHVEFVRNSGNHGFAHGCNLGAAKAAGGHLLFLNPDCVDPKQSVGALWEFARSRAADIVSCRQIDGADRLQKAFGSFPGLLTSFGTGRALARLLWRRRFPRPGDVRQGWKKVDWVSGSVLLITADALRQLDGWHDGYWMYSEDVDLCRRANNIGLVALYTADVTIVHHHGGSSRQNLATCGLTRAETAISRHLYTQRHLGPVKGLCVHLLLIVSRYGGLLPARLWHLVSRRQSSASITFDHLTRYYRGALSSRSWVSPRSVRHGSDDGDSGESVNGPV